MKHIAPLSLRITPNAADDAERLALGLARLMAEDSTLTVRTDRATGEVVIGAVGELYLEIIIDRLKREFNVAASVGRPEVVYKATLTRPADGEAKYAAQTSGRGQYAHVKIHLFPGEPGAGYVFEDKTTGGVIPKEFVAPVDEGIREASLLAVSLGSPIVEDARIELYDGSYHAVDSSAGAFRIAGAMAFQDAVGRTSPVLLEPVMRVEVVVAGEHMGNVIANLSSRRGQIQSHDARGDMGFISANVPLSEMFGYATDLRARTRGRGTFAMELRHYQPCRPPEDDDGSRDSFVGAPLRPRPLPRNFRVALPEPDEERPLD